MFASLVTVAGATVAGAVLRRRLPDRSVLASAVAAAVLLGVVLADLVPDVLADVDDGTVPAGVAAAAAATGFAAAVGIARRGCVCRAGRATVLAVAAHRAVEGSALVLAWSVPLLVGLVVHAAGEGFAMADLLGRGRALPRWLAVACSAPLVGALAVADVSVAAAPVATALVAGTLTGTAVAALRGLDVRVSLKEGL